MSNKKERPEIDANAVSKECVIQNLLILPQLIFDLSHAISEAEHEILAQRYELEKLKNEYQAFLAIAHLL